MDFPSKDIAAAVLRIDLAAIRANYRFIRKAAGGARVAGVVKADGYGLDAHRVAAVLLSEGCRDFFVAHLSEAIALCPAMPEDARLYILNGLPPGAEQACVSAGVIPVLNARDQVDRWSAMARLSGRRLPAAVQVDSGMARLGLAPSDVSALDVIEPVLLMSHLACADDPGAPANAAQRATFDELSARFPGVPRSLANSGGALLGQAFRYDMVRAGIALYGGAPHTGFANPLRPVVSLTAQIVQVRDLPAGAGVGYGLSFTTTRDSRIATIGVGYADGWPRSLSNRGAAYIGGVRVPIAGRVSMDSITLDVTGIARDRLAPGAPVELLGPNQTIDAVAADAGTISYEILTQLGRRYAREYEDDAA